MMRRRDRTRGQALAEFALVLPLFVLVVFGLFDGARAVYTYSTLSNATRVAARVAIVNQDQTAIRTAARDAGVGIGLSDADVTLTPCTTITRGCLYAVEVRKQFEPLTPGLGQIFRPELASRVSMPVERKSP